MIPTIKAAASLVEKAPRLMRSVLIEAAVALDSTETTSVLVTKSATEKRDFSSGSVTKRRANTFQFHDSEALGRVGCTSVIVHG